MPEIIRDGIDGFFGDDVAELAYMVERVGDLDRAEISRSVRERFSAGRMTDGYEAIYRAALGEGDAAEPDGASAEDRTDESASAPRPIRPLPATAVR